MWPNVPPAAATVIGLIGVNVAVWMMWKIPPAWRMLNKYFISVPVFPYSASMVGSVFSHQQLRHLGVNMAILWFIGTKRECPRQNLPLNLTTSTLTLISSPRRNRPRRLPCALYSNRSPRFSDLSGRPRPDQQPSNHLPRRQRCRCRHNGRLVHASLKVRPPST